MKNRIEQKLQNGYQLETGRLIDDSFALFKKNFLTAGFGVIVLCIIMAVVYGGIFAAIFGLGDIQNTLLQFETLAFDPKFILGNTIVTTILTAIVAPVTAGFIHLNYLTKFNKEYSVGTIFEFYSSKHFKDLFFAYAIIGFTTAVVSSILSFVRLEFFNFIFQGAISCFTIFTIPLIIYGEQNFTNAISKSLTLFLKQPLAIILGLIVAGIGAMLGIVAICIGIFFTLPFVYSMYFAIFDQAIGFGEESEIDEIGSEQI